MLCFEHCVCQVILELVSVISLVYSRFQTRCVNSLSSTQDWEVIDHVDREPLNRLTALDETVKQKLKGSLVNKKMPFIKTP